MAFLWTCLITCIKTEEPVQPIRDPIILDELLEDDLDDLPEEVDEDEESKDTGYLNDEDWY